MLHLLTLLNQLVGCLANGVVIGVAIVWLREQCRKRLFIDAQIARLRNMPDPIAEFRASQQALADSIERARRERRPN